MSWAVPKRFDLDLFRQLEWKRFEDLCVHLFRFDGFEADYTVKNSDGSDGGIDIFVDAGKAQLVPVQCKNHRNSIQEKHVREFFGVTAERFDIKVFITTGDFNDRAKRFASDRESLVLVNGEMLLQDINQLPNDKKRELLELSVEGEFWRPTCSKCLGKMNIVTRKKRRYWQCPKSNAHGISRISLVKAPDCPTCKEEMMLRTSCHRPFWGCRNYHSKGCSKKFELGLEPFPSRSTKS